MWSLPAGPRSGRAADAETEIEALRHQHAAVGRELAKLDPPARRVVHNDCKINNLLLRELLEQTSAWEEVTFDDSEAIPVSYAHPAQAVA